MNNKIYNKWIHLHNNSNLRNEMPSALYDSWERSYLLNVDPQNSTPKVYTDKEFNIIKDNWNSLYYYANDILTTSSKNFNESNFGIALFDNTGCLIKLYGNDKFYKWAQQNNLQKKTLWNENTIGTNAVSLGLKLKKTVSVIGEQHFSKFAINFAMYFAPIIVEKSINENSEFNDNDNPYGGIAVIAPVKNKNSSFLIIADTFSKAISLQFLWFYSVPLFINSVDSYIIIDQSNNTNKIIFISKQIFSFLNTPFKDMLYKDLEEIIDPYPHNKKFWNIINKKTKIQDTELNVLIQSNPVKINFSVRPFYVTSFHIEGVSIIVNSHERIQNLISKHTGNNATFTFPQIIGKDANFLNVINQAKAAANSTVNILVLGESGVGKDIIAQSIHNASDRKNKPFIAINCAAFPKELISSELFGYEDGAFTGCKKGGHIGKFELANHGTIFLDEIGDMPLDLQALLLRVIEQKNFMKMGSTVSTNIDVRIIAATNKNLKEMVKKNEFREDLYYRLGIIKIVIPPMRDRKKDILLFAEQYIERICKRVNKPLVTLSPEVKEFFLEYHWPGNVRELQNMLEGVIQVYDSPVITLEHISHYIMEEPPEIKHVHTNIHKKEKVNIKSSIPDSKEYIIHALELNKYNKTDTAKYLGISRKTLYSRLKKYNLM